MDQKAEERQFFNENFTLKGRIFFPKILAPEANQNGVLKYSAMFAWDIGSNPEETARFGQFLGAAKQKFFPTIPAQHFLNPIKKWGVYVKQDGSPNHSFLENCYWINATSGDKYPPVVVDGHRQPLLDGSLVYSGANAVVNVSCYKISGEKFGVGLNLGAIMLIGGGDKEGGVPKVDVNAVFGGFAADMGVQTPTNTAPQNQNVFGQQQQAPIQQQQQAPIQQQQQAPDQGHGYNPNTPDTNNGGGGFI